MADDLPRFLSAAQLADELDVHRNTIYLWIKRGEVPGARKIGGEWRVPRWALDEIGQPAHMATA